MSKEKGKRLQNNKKDIINAKLLMKDYLNAMRNLKKKEKGCGGFKRKMWINELFEESF